MEATNKRLASIDLLRGLTVMLMIFVNNGAGDSIFPTLRHSQWNGLTLADCVFPSFLFIMGMSTYLSLRKFQFRWSKAVAWKVIRRAVILFLLGLAINYLDMALGGHPLDFGHLRVWGVMQRLGICYLLCAVLALTCRRGFIPIIILGLAAYAALLLCCGGYDYDSTTNILAKVDNGLVGWNHLYHKSPVDPEGLVSTFSATLHTMIGFVVMEHLAKAKTLRGKTMFLDIVGVVMLAAGIILSVWLPLNKRVWSPSYVLVTTSIVCVVLGVLVDVVDKPTAEKRPWLQKRLGDSTLLKAFGMNPLVLYVGSEALAIIVGKAGIKDWAYDGIHAVISNAAWAGFVYALLFTAVFAVVGVWMYRRKVFVKI